MPVSIRGKQYVTVAERLRSAHAEKVQPRGIAGIATPRSMA